MKFANPIILAGTVVMAMTMLSSLSQAGPVTVGNYKIDGVFIDDTSRETAYHGGCRTTPANCDPGYYDEVIGGSAFQIHNMRIGRVTEDNDGDGTDFSGRAYIRIETNYVGNRGASGTGFGDLLLHAHRLGEFMSQVGDGPEHLGDGFFPQAGGSDVDGAFDNEWNFAVKMINTDAYDPESKETTQIITYTTDLLAISDDDIWTSNRAFRGSFSDGCGNYRCDQAVAVGSTGVNGVRDNGNRDGGGTSIGNGKAYVVLTNNVNGYNSIEFFIDDSALGSFIGRDTFGHDWGASWAMTCSNDIVQLDWPVSVPEPTTLAIFGVGLLGLGIRRRLKAAA